MPSLTTAENPSKLHIEIAIQFSGISALDHLHDYLHSDPALPKRSKQQLKNDAMKGAIWLTAASKPGQKPRKPERLRRVKKTLNPHDKIDFYLNTELLDSTPKSPTLIADMKEYSVWLKPRGMLSQGSKWADHTALYRWVEMNYKPNNQPRQAWIVHRLDRATQGLMLLAHSKKMATRLSQLFESDQIEKIYQANVWGSFPTEKITVDLPVNDKPAISHIQRLEHYSTTGLKEVFPAGICRVKVKIETGRKHQIRSHLSQSGFPIVGDRLYGRADLDNNLNIYNNLTNDLQLTSYHLRFLCPISKTEQLFELPEAELDLLTFY